MPVIVTSDRSQRVALNGNDTFYLSDDADVVVASGPAASTGASAKGLRAFVDGLLLGLNGPGLSLGSGGGHLVRVGASGEIGALGADDAGLELRGFYSTLDNHGSIWGHRGLSLVNARSARIDNAGEIAGLGADGIHISGTSSVWLTNGGTIAGQRAIALESGNLRVLNTGRIQGSENEYDGVGIDAAAAVSRLHVVNDGVISGGSKAVIGSASGDTLINRGAIDGAVDLGAGADFYDARRGQPATLVELGDGDDVAYGSAGDDVIYGSEGNDRLHAGAGDDSLYGGAGSDIIRAGVGDDLVYGGDQIDTIWGGDGDDTADGGAADDFVSGGAGDDRLYGNDGADRLEGGAGEDYLVGGVGGDTLFGGAGDDVMIAEAGDDRLVGGKGDDNLNGGAGRDRFEFKRGDGHDRIAAFENGLDKIDLADLGFLTVSAVRAISRDVVGGVIIDLPGDANSLYVENFKISQMTTDDFIF